MNSTDIDISRVARTLLVHQGKSKTALAEALGISPSVLSKKLGRHRGWGAEEVASMAEFFDVNVAVFFEHPDTLVRSRYFLSNPLVSA